MSVYYTLFAKGDVLLRMAEYAGCLGTNGGEGEDGFQRAFLLVIGMRFLVEL